MHTKWQTDLGLGQLLSTSLIAVSGIDAETFLQGQLTVNLKNVTTSMSQLAAHCNLKGRMQSVFRLIKNMSSPNDAFLLLTPKALLPLALTNLKKYAIFSKVTLHEANDYTVFGLVGTGAPSLLNAVDLPIGGCLAREQYIICRIPGVTPRFEIIVPTTFAEKFAANYSTNTVSINDEVWERLDIEAGIPTIYPETQDVLLPHHANLMDLKGISLDKGCYLGQEIIARMHYKGKIKRHMYRALLPKMTEVPYPGDLLPIVDAPNEAPGIVVRSAPSDEGFELLVVLDEQYADFEKIRFKKADGPKLHRLDLSY